jgi:hypothetical protein
VAKVLKTSNKPFIAGGNGHMVGKQSAGPQKAGTSAKSGSGGGKFAKGGNGKMVGKQAAVPSKAGQAGK